jgi:hypothetical protein
MTNVRSLLFASLIFIALLIKEIDAGAEANVNACVYLETEPPQPTIYAFKNGGYHCMYQYTLVQNITVTNAGITCTDSTVKIESKASSSGGDLCATDDSIWALGFNAYDQSTDKPTGSTGAITTKWSAPIFSSDNVKVTGNAVVCSLPALCTEKEMDWHGTGSVHFIFKPSSLTAPEPSCTDKAKHSFKAYQLQEQLTCGRLAQMSTTLREVLCKVEISTAAFTCPGVCADKCKCTDEKSSTFETKWKSVSCLELSQLQHRRRHWYCKYIKGARSTCPDTCGGWC